MRLFEDERLLTCWVFRVGAYTRWALIRGGHLLEGGWLIE